MAIAAPVKLDLVQGSEAWLAARSDGISSSYMPVIAGESPYQSPTELWATMTGLVPATEPDPGTRRLMDIGKRMEPVLLDLYEVETGRRARRVPRMLAHPTYPWARASLDAEAPVKRIVEAKWTHARRWSSGDPVPADVLIQVQWQMFVTGRDVADVVALVGPELRVVEVGRDEKMIDDLLFLATDFWGHVQDRTAPDVDGSESTRRTLARIHPVDDGSLLASDPVIDQLMSELLEARAVATAADNAKDTLENALRALLGDASGVKGPGYSVSWKRNADSTRTDIKSLASAYRDAIEGIRELDPEPVERVLSDGFGTTDLDDIAALHTTTSEGPRVLRVTFAKEEAYL